MLWPLCFIKCIAVRNISLGTFFLLKRWRFSHCVTYTMSDFTFWKKELFLASFLPNWDSVSTSACLIGKRTAKIKKAVNTYLIVTTTQLLWEQTKDWNHQKRTYFRKWNLLYLPFKERFLFYAWIYFPCNL